MHTDTAFNQQNLKAWRPILTPRAVVIMFSVVGVIFIPVGSWIISLSDTVRSARAHTQPATCVVQCLWCCVAAHPDARHLTRRRRSQVVEAITDDYAGSCCVDNCTSTLSFSQVDRNPCDVQLVVPATMHPPIFMYYRLTNYFQNHRRYVKSKNDKQLKGLAVEDKCARASAAVAAAASAPPALALTLSPSPPDIADYCEHASHKGGGGPANQISPCGLVAASLFNDSFALSAPDGSPVHLDSTDIAWASDRQWKFLNSAAGTTGQNYDGFAHWRSRTCAELPTATQRDACTAAAIPQAGWCYPRSGYCVEDQHFIVWMRSAGLPNFRKLYAKINVTLQPGTYTIRVSNGLWHNGAYVNPARANEAQPFLYPTRTFGGTKALVFTTTSVIGGKNYFLGYTYVVVGTVCLALALLFAIKVWRDGRELGTAPFVTWQRERVKEPAKQG